MNTVYGPNENTVYRRAPDSLPRIHGLFISLNVNPILIYNYIVY